MNLQQLGDLLQCRKKYEMSCFIQSKEIQQEQVFRNALDQLLVSVIEKTEKKSWCKAIEQIFVVQLKDEWFDLVWQKKQTINRYMDIIERLYDWMISHVKGEILAINQAFVVQPDIICNGIEVHEITLKADFVIRMDEEVIWGIFLCQKFPRLCGSNSGNVEKSSWNTVEMVSFLAALQQEYPNKIIKVSYIQAVSFRDTADFLSTFEARPGDNIMTFTSHDLFLQEQGCAVNLLTHLLNRIKGNGCNGCRYYKEICIQEELSPALPLKRKDRYSLKEPTVNQKMAIERFDQAMLVCAGPGAGKTATLVARVDYMLTNGISPGRIFVLTFTRKAAQEVEERISHDMKPNISTIHALAFQIIRQHEYILGKRKLVNQTDCQQLLLQVLNCSPIIKNVNYQKLTGKQGLLALLLSDFCFIQKFGVAAYAEQFPKKDIETIVAIKKLYDQKFQAGGYIRFDEQISLAVWLLEQFPGIRKKLQNMYSYILVDEAQDIDEMQGKLIRLLVEESNPKIAIFGDTDQAIYGFRGGSNKFMLEFLQLYPEALEIKLNDNFRSSKEILDMANRLISHNKTRVPMQMVSHLSTGRKPMVLSNFRANRIGQLLHDLLEDGYEQGDIAVIARTNKDLLGLGKLIDAFNMEHQNSEKLRFFKPKYYLYQDSVYQTVLDLLSLHQGILTDDYIWYRLLSKLGVSVQKAHSDKCIYESYLEDQAIYPFTGEEAGRYLLVSEGGSQFLNAVAKLYKASRLFSLPAADAISKVLDFFYEGKCNGEVQEILETMIRERHIRTASELWHYMTAIKFFDDETRVYMEGDSTNAIHLVTAHDSKGKEYKAVIVYGVDDFELDNLQEDRRLLYVAVTRAKERLYLTEVCKGKSMFLKEIKSHVEEIGGLRYA
ncbi:ATP-dependent helicase [Mediterraneibacter gnavus]|uniref:DNA 3'-5' helicase n=2 Tax=Bacillota TaxID=1239 RepID=A0A415SAK8_MEDGN|nr:ATP-dependent helicase [Mediterraneibacter gnavus]RHM77651.1 ATP-dependent helicase [Mediterraneibacter gnavus]